jgi:hypothetical protein
VNGLLGTVWLTVDIVGWLKKLQFVAKYDEQFGLSV